MAKGQISAMDWATLPFTGSETVEIVQSGGNVRVRITDLIANGADGKSAFELAKDAGFDGDVTAWLNSLIGPEGPEGPEGPRGPKGERGTDGADGQDGANGESAFEVYKRVVGWDGTEEEWVNDVLENSGGTGGGTDGQDGADGESAYELYKRVTGWDGTEEEFAEEIKGEKGDTGTPGADGQDGESAYELYQRVNGWEGTEAEFAEEIKGDPGADGADGESAYALAVRVGGYEGTEEDFAALLAAIESGGTGDGGGGTTPDLGTGISQMGVMRIKVNDFPTNDWELPEGVSVTKVYDDSSIELTHSVGRTPVHWSMLNLDADPPGMFVITEMRNMQVIDENTIRLTNVNTSNQYELNIFF